MLSNGHTNANEIGQLYCISHIESLAWSLFNEGQQNSTHKEILLYSLIKHAVSTRSLALTSAKYNNLYFSRKKSARGMSASNKRHGQATL